jgi:hypothetical protein
MAFVLHANASWVETDGSYGTSDVITFDSDDLTQEQWDRLSDMRDSDRMGYVYAIMAGEPLDEWEED